MGKSYASSDLSNHRYISHDELYNTAAYDQTRGSTYSQSYYPGTTSFNTNRVYSHDYNRADVPSYTTQAPTSYITQAPTTYTTQAPTTYTTQAPSYSYVSGESPVRYTQAAKTTGYQPNYVGHAIYGLAGQSKPRVVRSGNVVADPNEVVVQGGKPQKFRAQLPNVPGKIVQKNCCGCTKGSMWC
jgi:hypothetical protein